MSASPPQSAEGRGAVYKSAALAVALQWSMRLIGLVSVFILARLLSPQDFGIAGLAMASVALVEIFSVIGLRQALLRIPAPERSHLDTAWTIQLLLFGILGLVLLALAPLAARFYEEPALGPVIAILSSRFLFLGLVNIGIVDFDRNLEFGRDLRMRVGARLISFAVTVTAAVLLRSYWALVIGLVLQSAMFTAASYAAHPFRPRLSLARRSELLSVSGWMFLGFSGQVLHHQIERLVIGRFGGMHLVGLYSVSKDLSAIFTQEIATALNRVTFVTTARSGQKLSEAPERLVTMLGAYAMIAAPLGLGLAASAEDGLAVLLGSQWLDAATLLQLIAPASALYAVYKLIASSLQAAGYVRGVAAMTCGGAAAAAVAVGTVGFRSHDAVAMALAALAVSGGVLLVGTIVLSRVARSSLISLVIPIVRPFLAAVAMLVLVRVADPSSGSAVLDLTVEVLTGAAAFSSMLFLLWLASGRPAGAEAEAVDFLRRSRLARRLRSALAA
ncbi:MAG TPA: oligosaccharide flippase family protein [Allosphingosinicella sp.]